MKRRIILMATILFIGTNLYLVKADDEGKIDRISYIDSWSKPKTQDLRETLHTDGVFTSQIKDHLYFDKSLGNFETFLVEEGDRVTIGDPLFTYKVYQYGQVESQLLSKIDQLEDEVDSIEAAIDSMEMQSVSNNRADGLANFDVREEQIEIEVELPQSTKEAEMIKQQYLIEKDKELKQKQAELAYVEDQLMELRSTGDSITVESPYDGNITFINTALEDPILTIESSNLKVAGELTEDERRKVEQGLPVEVITGDKEEPLEGTIEQISNSPKNVQLHGESIYPFSVSLNEEASLTNLKSGYHTELVVTVKESLDALALSENAVHKKSVWKMTESGTMINEIVETGIVMDHMVEVTNGVQKNDYVAEKPMRQFRNGAIFITPLEFNYLSRDSLASENNNWKRYLITGLLSR
ncbi:efflux RND transporter periplasmic adaptor subunit [Oceanobacillus senegalensis]|uniref:efflux RND transporter periplasmic adaptor subunit n=1 Tax=Oceanobacillus senegalensis TaxID=1936063 RepID=UPI000A3058C1|nr:efflux RND transporter periplasmic adaptor subunit [Oceanobacillus senegalensis]